MIDFNRPALVGKELNYIQDAVAQGMLCGDGKYTKLCSEWMKKRFEVNQVFLTTSCTHALEMAAFLSNIQPGDEVIMPSYTFVSTADAFVLRGAKIVFVDIRPDTMNIDENLIEQAITDKTRAIVPLVIPLTRLLVGKTYGSTATIVPLVIAAAPFIARMVESSLKEVDPGVVEAAVSMGAGTRTIIWKVLLAESRTSLLVGVTIAVGTILGYSAMAGTVGGGGLGDIAIRYGYYRYQTDIMIVTIVILVVLVQILQGLGMMLSRKLDKRKA